MVKEFNVLIENNGKFEPYNIMRYLKNSWERFIERRNEVSKDPEWDDDFKNDSYWTYPETFEQIKKWIDRELKYQYWARCEYEIILSSWPSYDLDEDTKKYKKGTVVIPDGKGRKIDIYEQCKMNLDIITQIFLEDIYLPSVGF